MREMFERFSELSTDTRNLTPSLFDDRSFVREVQLRRKSHTLGFQANMQRWVNPRASHVSSAITSVFVQHHVKPI